jgi:glycosyltransferase involved in cell wall biosynthesis
MRLAFHDYDAYILTGEPYCISSWIILIITKLRRKKTYLWTHGWYGREDALKTLIKRLYFRLSSGIFLYSDYAKTLMIKEGIRKEILHVIYNSLDYDSQLSVRSGLRKTNIFDKYFKNNYPTLIFTGRLTEQKRLDLLIDAHCILQTQGMYCNIIIVGGGKIGSLLKNRIKELSLDGYYWFYGECYDESVIGELYYNADICISPGNVGLTAIHAMMYGCPVITHDNFSMQMPEFEAIERGVTGNFFVYNDSHSLASTIANWLKSNSNKTRETICKCFAVVDNKYNPYYQMDIMQNAMNP